MKIETLGDAWAVMERYGIPHPPIVPVYDNSLAVAQAIVDLETKLAAVRGLITDKVAQCCEERVHSPGAYLCLRCHIRQVLDSAAVTEGGGDE